MPGLILSRFSHVIGGLGRAALRSGRNGLLFTGTSSTSESESDSIGDGDDRRDRRRALHNVGVRDESGGRRTSRSQAMRRITRSLSHTRRATRRGRHTSSTSTSTT
eukprot:scaffold4994_cov123-Isochrysis_galbana.AAC.1